MKPADRQTARRRPGDFPRATTGIEVGSSPAEPYTFGGIGWNHYSVVTDSANTSSIDDSDDVMTVPLGVEIALGFMGVTLDARATYRQALDSDIFGSETSSFADTSMNSWGAGALGFEF